MGDINPRQLEMDHAIDHINSWHVSHFAILSLYASLPSLGGVDMETKPHQQRNIPQELWSGGSHGIVGSGPVLSAVSLSEGGQWASTRQFTGPAQTSMTQYEPDSAQTHDALFIRRHRSVLAVPGLILMEQL